MKNLAVAVSVLFLVATHDVRATLFTAVDFSELVSSARAIAHGQIVDVSTRATDDRIRIETLVTLRVTDYLKGDLGPEVTFVIPGGSLGRYRTVIIGAPHFQEGEDVVLFLGAQGPSRPYILRLGQGVFRVVLDQSTGQQLVTPRPALGLTEEWQPVIRGIAANRPMTLPEFATHVQSALERAR